jgi:hypothetical protein
MITQDEVYTEFDSYGNRFRVIASGNSETVRRYVVVKENGASYFEAVLLVTAKDFVALSIISIIDGRPTSRTGLSTRKLHIAVRSIDLELTEWEDDCSRI